MTTKLPKQSPSWRRKLRRFLYGIPKSLLIGIVVIGILVYVFVQQFDSGGAKTTSKDDTTTTSETKKKELPKGKPTYTTYLPSGKTIDDYGGWTRISPVKNDPVYAYVDKIGKVTIRVSQQRIPKAFEGDVENKVQKLADDFLATQKITVEDLTVHVGRSASGVESIIFVIDDTLLNITTDGEVSDNSLIKYIKSLR